MLKQLILTNFRNYPQATFCPDRQLSLVYGGNGSGKTSLLESIYTLSTGRSFRTHKLHRLVSASQPGFTLFAEVENEQGLFRLGMQRGLKGIEELRLDGRREQRLSEFALRLPVQVFHPDSIQLVLATAQFRRAWLDWGLFHVEPTFLACWRSYRQLLQQRNALLKRGRPSLRHELSVWDQQLIELSGRIDRLRSDYLAEVELALPAALQKAGLSIPVDLSYAHGWPAAMDFSEALQRQLVIDLERGFTSVGPHRADVRLRVDEGLAKDYLSRGQCKLLSYALLLAQLEVLLRQPGDSPSRCLLLVDDLASELDSSHRESLFQALLGLKQQMVVTSLQEEPLIERNNAAVFHVEQNGLIKRSDS